MNPTLLAARYPSVEAFQNPDSVFFKILGGVSAGLVYSLFFSILPQVFKAFANFEGTASSKVKAEENAIRFYWYFMLVTAFTGTSLVTMLVDGIIKGKDENAYDDLFVRKKVRKRKLITFPRIFCFLSISFIT